MTSAHRTYANRSDVVVGRIKARRDNVRYWFSADYRLVGIWQGRNGKTYAVGHSPSGDVILYRASEPGDGWQNGSADCRHGYDTRRH